MAAQGRRPIAKLGSACLPRRALSGICALDEPGCGHVGRERLAHGRAAKPAGLRCILGRGNEMAEEGRKRSPAARP
jgi:hypothetical protein